jgi:hypothetical protein
MTGENGKVHRLTVTTNNRKKEEEIGNNFASYEMNI